MDEVEWRKHEGERWQGKRRVNREQEEEADASPMPEHDAIGQLAHELETPKKAHGDWAEEVERDLGYSTQGEYKPTSYSQQPAPSPPAPWYLPQPPTSDYAPPRTHYLPPHRRYSRPETPYTPRRLRFHPTPAPNANGDPLAKTEQVT